PEKILGYLQIYVDFLDDMAAHGFNPERGKDPVGVAITRDGTIVKVNRGLHRLAMAQRLGLPSIPVQVRHVHRIWWDKVTEGASGDEALAKMAAALKHCVPEEHPGPLDERPEVELPPDFWPAPRIPACDGAVPPETSFSSPIPAFRRYLSPSRPHPFTRLARHVRAPSGRS